MIFPEDLTRSLLDALSIHEAILRQDPGRNALASPHNTTAGFRPRRKAAARYPQRVAYGEALVSRSPELVAASSPAAGTLVVTLPNASLVTHAGTFVSNTATCSKAPANTTAGMQFPRVGNNGALVPVGFAIDGANVTASCDARGAPVRCTSTATPPRASCTAQRRGCRRSRSKPTARQSLQRRWPSALLPATTR
eukprot:gene22781-16581_t